MAGVNTGKAATTKVIGKIAIWCNLQQLPDLLGTLERCFPNATVHLLVAGSEAYQVPAAVEDRIEVQRIDARGGWPRALLAETPRPAV